ncbi:sugar transferase, partial [Candidatus Desantisbacteria bacterium]|nr:sugar transferase [Candidatus Desantisbacteria bacterium]
KYWRKKGYNTRNILIIGTGTRAQNFIKSIEKHSEWGLKILGLLDEDPRKKDQIINNYKVIGCFEDLVGILHTNVVDHAIFIVPRLWFEKIENLISICEMEGVTVTIAVDLYELKFSKAKQTDLDGHPLLTFQSAPDKVGCLFIKRMFDFILSGIALLILSPVFIIIPLIEKISKGKVFFKQERCGLNGRKYILYKFRTMVENAENKINELYKFNEMKGPVFKMKNDPRITKFGRFMRKFSIDEFPQLWNVFKGDMSIVGPRPPLPSEVNKYDSWHRRRLSMKPGLTCLWQILGRNEITDFDEWMKLDLEYIDKWSLILDLKIVLKTIPIVLLGKGAK